MTPEILPDLECLDTVPSRSELLVLRNVYDLLEPLEADVRSRLVTYVCRLLEIEVDL